MIQINLKKENTITKLNLIDSWDGITVQQFIDYIKLERKARDIETELLDLQDMWGEEEPDEMSVLDIVELDNNLFMVRADQLAILTMVPSLRKGWAHDRTKALDLIMGISKQELISIFTTLAGRLGSFEDWFESLPSIKEIHIKQKGENVSFFRSLVKQKYKVFPMPQTTLLRDTSAVNIAMRIARDGQKMIDGEYELMPLLLAFICRPANEEYEFSVSSRKRVVGGKRFEQLSAQDRLSYYNETIAKRAEERKDMFAQVKLGTAFGIYKQYFFLGTPQQRPTKPFTQKSRSFHQLN